MLWRILESLHGHFAVLAAAALLHPAILMRKGAPLSRGGRWSVALTALSVALAFGSGLTIYKAYVAQVRVPLFLRNDRAGLLFETKEHLAFAVVTIALGAAACAWWAPSEARELRRAAAVAFAAAAALCIATAILGTYVAGVHGFGSAR
jgi:uncharacterized BrkB/YihY/UPF0761 family membrane protein